MSQRNPLNERYTTDKKRSGNTRKSAASAKPKSSAAASVRTASKKKKSKKISSAKNNSKNTRREERNKQYEAERKYGEPPTKRFKTLKKLWIGSLIAAIAAVAASFAYNKIEGLPEGGAMVCIGLAYVFIIITLYLDFGKIRKERKKYAAKMRAVNAKEERAEEKKRKAAQRAAKKEAEAKRLEEEKKRKESQEELKNATGLDKIKLFFKKQ